MPSTQHQFLNLINQAKAQHVTAYQWGNQVPVSPQKFLDDLLEQAKAYGINWPDSVEPESTKQITKATLEYIDFYEDLLTKPEPSNPTDEFHAWFVEAHK